MRCPHPHLYHRLQGMATTAAPINIHLHRMEHFESTGNTIVVATATTTNTAAVASKVAMRVIEAIQVARRSMMPHMVSWQPWGDVLLESSSGQRFCF